MDSVVALRLEQPVIQVGLSGTSPLSAPASLQRTATSSQPGFAKSYRELPARYRRKPLDEIEIEYITVIAYLLHRCLYFICKPT